MRRWSDGTCENLEVFKLSRNQVWRRVLIENQRVGQDISGSIRKRAQQKSETSNLRKQWKLIQASAHPTIGEFSTHPNAYACQSAAGLAKVPAFISSVPRTSRSVQKRASPSPTTCPCTAMRWARSQGRTGSTQICRWVHLQMDGWNYFVFTISIFCSEALFSDSSRHLLPNALASVPKLDFGAGFRQLEQKTCSRSHPPHWFMPPSVNPQGAVIISSASLTQAFSVVFWCPPLFVDH